MERIREEMERVNENGTRGVQDRFCCFCTRSTNLCHHYSGPRCSPRCELYERKQQNFSDKESEIVPETTRYIGNTFGQMLSDG